MRTKYITLAAWALLLASCTIQVDDNKHLTPTDEFPVFYATLEGSNDVAATKVFADSKMRVLWNANDLISIFYKNAGNMEFAFQGEDGDNAGTFSFVSGAASGEALDHIYALYPYSEATAVSQDGTVSVTLPAEQAYKTNSFGIGANTMLSVTDDYKLMFRNVGAYLCFKFYGDNVSVKSITLQGNNHEKLAGKASITMPVNGTPTVEMQDGATESITLTCTTPVVLGADAEHYTEFWFVLPPTDFTQGITVTVVDDQNGTFVMNSSTHLVFTRNKLTRLGAKKIVPSYDYSIPEAVDLGLPSGTKWASFNLGATAPEEAGCYFAWGETEPKAEYRWSTYKWCNGSETSLTKYNSDSSLGAVDHKTILDLEDDAAHVKLGDNWRMPTSAELAELAYSADWNLCTWTWEERNGIYGYTITSKSNGNSIFLPAAGYIYGTTLSQQSNYGQFLSSNLSVYAESPVYLDFNQSHHYIAVGMNGPMFGRSIRPVYGEWVAVTGIELDDQTVDLTVGETYSLTASITPDNATYATIDWVSSDENVFAFNTDYADKGTAMGPGTATITAYTGNGLSASCTVTVSYPVPEAVDLGLPSGTKWASFNLGATAPEEAGCYFAWGETEPKDSYTWSNYQWCEGNAYSYTKYNTNSSYGIVDNKITLDLADDAAHVHLGGDWRMPTITELDELADNCTRTWTTRNEIEGYLYTSKLNGNSIFLPALTNYYWTSSDDQTKNAWYPRAIIIKENYVVQSSAIRYGKAMIRPVSGPFVEVAGISLDPSTVDARHYIPFRLSATVTPANATDKHVLWMSGDKTIAWPWPSTEGIIECPGLGTTSITVISNGHTASCEISVEELSFTEPEAIDLGLPSGTKWASFNLGASSPEDRGAYFTWGITEPGQDYGIQSKYNTDDGLTTLEPEDDAAHVLLGGSWRMPTKEEVEELLNTDYCSPTPLIDKERKLILGYTFTSKINGNSLFIPGTGYRLNGSGIYEFDSGVILWTSTADDNGKNAYQFSRGIRVVSSTRNHGLNIRPVCDPANP